MYRRSFTSLLAVQVLVAATCSNKAGPEANGSADADAVGHGGAGHGGGGSGGARSGSGTGGSGGVGGVLGTGATGGGGKPSVETGNCSGMCEPGAFCGGCAKGGTMKLACTCFAPSPGEWAWTCVNAGPCGSNGCGPAGAACDPRGPTNCEMCDANGTRQECMCAQSGSQTTWSCSSASSAGNCGVTCGDHRCLPGELCINFGQYAGTPIDGGIPTPILYPTCVLLPDACGAQEPSCQTCIVSTYGCSPPGVCRDLGSQTFDCILGGA